MMLILKMLNIRYLLYILYTFIFDPRFIRLYRSPLTSLCVVYRYVNVGQKGFSFLRDDSTVTRPDLEIKMHINIFESQEHASLSLLVLLFSFEVSGSRIIKEFFFDFANIFSRGSQ